METLFAYASYGLYEVNFNKSEKTFTIGCGKNKNIVCGKALGLERFSHCETEYIQENRHDVVKIIFDKDNILTFRVGFDGVTAESGGICFECEFYKNENIIPMSSKVKRGVLRSALGCAVPSDCDMLFDRESDTSYNINGEILKIYFDYKAEKYAFNAGSGFVFSVTENLYKNMYRIEYKGMNKNNTFGKLPPVGWMSWYAVKFNASEKTVLDNARWQSEKLKDYGANAVWVDWEWYHKGLEAEGIRDDGVDSFNPDPVKYPSGLKFVSDEIRNLGLIPCLWVGFTNETFETEYLKAHPEVLLVKELTWAGTYFFDITHPLYLNDFLPKALKQVEQWGYEGVKFDTFPICMERQEKYHERLYDPSQTVYEAYRNLMKKTREVLGEDRYLLSCSGEKHPNIVWAADIIDGARIGGDIFKWDEFINNCVKRTLEFYHFHNIMFYNDPDNIVLRDEFNTFTQAASRAAFVSMLGMPVTFGDELLSLPDDRVNIIKRVIPSLDIHPVNAETDAVETKILVTNLLAAKPWETYNVVSVFNTTEDEENYVLDFKNTLDLDGGEYFVYDYWNDKFLGAVTDCLPLTLNPCETRVLSVRKVSGLPQIISTNRHISQGAMEITKLGYNNSSLEFSCSLVKNDMYKAVIYIPDKYTLVSADRFRVTKTDNLLSLEFMPEETGEYEFKVVFE